MTIKTVETKKMYVTPTAHAPTALGNQEGIATRHLYPCNRDVSGKQATSRKRYLPRMYERVSYAGTIMTILSRYQTLPPKQKISTMTIIHHTGHTFQARNDVSSIMVD